MALVVLLRGVNVGGHRTFRPAKLAEQLRHLDAVNIGAAGTFVIRRPVTRDQLRAELTRRLPFDAEIMICEGREIAGLIAQHPFADQPARPDMVRFVSVLSRRPRSAPSTPMRFPASGTWLLKILARDNRFVFGVYRRQHESDQLPRHGGPAVRGAGHHAQLEYHHRDRHGAGQRGGQAAPSERIIFIASCTVVMNCAGKMMVEFFSTLISAMVCRVRSWSATGCAAMISAASPSLTAA